jgi:hypothetical protein
LHLIRAVVDGADHLDGLCWQAGDLRPDRRDSLVLLLPSRMLPPGLYRLTIEGVKDDGKTFAVAAYPFRVVRPD